MVGGHFGDVYETLDAVAHLDERTERHQLGDAAVDELAHLVAVGKVLPRIGLGRLQREADPFLGQIDIKHLDVDLVTDGHHGRRMVHVLPRQLGDVDEAVHAAEVHEGTEVDDRRDHTPATLARLEVDQELAPLLLLGLFQPGPPGEHHVVAVAVEFDDLGFDGLAHIRLEFAHPAKLHEGRREEAPQTDVHDEATLDHLDDRTGDHLVGLLQLLDRAPGPLVLGPLLGEDQPAFLVFLLENQRLNLFTEGDDLGGIHVVADGEFSDRDDPFRLESDVQQDFVPVDLHDGALDQIAVFELDNRAGHRIFERRAGEVVLGDRAGNVDPVFVKVTHRLGREQGGALGHYVCIGH